MNNLQLGKRLKELRMEKAKRMGVRKIPQHEVAKHLNVTKSAYASWEVGRTLPHVGYLLQLATYFDVTTDYLLAHKRDDQIILNDQTILSWTQTRPVKTENEAKGIHAWQLLTHIDPRKDAGIKSIGIELDITSSLEKELEKLVKDVTYTNLIEINHIAHDQQLSNQIQNKYKFLQDARVVSVPKAAPEFYKKMLVGEMARTYFTQFIRPGMKVGLAGGSSVSHFVYALRRGDCQSITVYPLAASPVASEAIAALEANTLVGTLACRHEGYNVQGYTLQYSSKSPGYEEDNAMQWGLTQRILNKAKGIDIGFIGVGSMKHKLMPIDFFWDNYKIAQELKEAGAVGDILFNYFDKDEKPIKSRLDNLVCAIELSDMAQIVQAGTPIVILAAGEGKAPITRIAVERRYANVLIIDEQLAKELLDNHGSTSG